MRTHLIKHKDDFGLRMWCGQRAKPFINPGEYINWKGKHVKVSHDERIADCQVCHQRYSQWHIRQS